jgi:general L-amino acid transport system substrate-binding protein
MKRILPVVATIAATVMAFPMTAQAGATLDAVMARGKLICGVNGGRVGMSVLTAKGTYVGMDIDTCHAVAAAVLGDKTKVQYVPTTNQTRFPALTSGDVDVLPRNVTWTLTRDTAGGMAFPVTTFYDGQAFMIPKKFGIDKATGLDGVTMCVLPGSTSEKVAADFFRSNNMKYTPLVMENIKELNAAFFAGRCDAFMQSSSGLSAIRSVAPNPNDYVILPERFGRDPMGPVVRHGDFQWYDIVAWTVYAMIEGERWGITSKNVDEFVKSKNPNIRRILGANPELGKALGLSPDWAYQVIKQVGNYKESFDRNFGMGSALKLKRGLNALWTDGGLIYSPPFK